VIAEDGGLMAYGNSVADMYLLVGNRSPDWLKCKNPAAPAVKREAEEDWG